MDERVLSVIVPAHNASAHLSACLGAIRAGDLDRDRYELIVVDDASTDSTSKMAGDFADAVVSTGNVARGPAYARNRGARQASAKLIAFVDADVALHPDALVRMVETLGQSTSLVAVFGSYDDAPADPGLISRYRNLLHHYAHNESAGNVTTFWAGCGAVRTESFFAAGQFDENRYPRPQIEDIDLGYRLARLGGILLDPSIQGKHFKRWAFVPMLRTDLLDRGIPWVRLLLRKERGAQAATPSLGRRAVLGTAAASLALAAAVAALAGGGQIALALFAALFVISLLLNVSFYGFLARHGGPALAILGVPLYFIYQIVSGIAVPIGAILHFSHDAPKATARPQ